MTRLTSSDVREIDGWAEYDRLIRGQLGVDLPGLAAAAADLPAAEVRRGLAGRKLAAVSISSGEGVVGGFAAGLAAIGRRLGLEARVMEAPDEAGFIQAARWGADLVIHADDERFLVRDRLGRTADNNPATSRAFVAALEMMAEGRSLAGREVVVLGLGVIGRGAALRLVELGAVPLMYDPDESRWPEAEAGRGPGKILRGREALAEALSRTSLIFEAVPSADVLDEKLWPAHPVVAAPGVPLAWPESWLRPGARGRLWHDPLQSGTAAMLARLSL